MKNSSTRILPIGTTIITARGTVGKLALLAEPMAMNQSCYGIQGTDNIGSYFTFFLLKYVVQRLKQNTHGAVFDTITTSTFNTIKVTFSSIPLTKLFEDLVEPLLQRIELNCRENQELVVLRDTLLPKLISGELEVNEALAQKP